MSDPPTPERPPAGAPPAGAPSTFTQTFGQQAADTPPSGPAAPEAPPAAAPRTARPAQVRSLTCPNCGSPITIRASGISISAACPSCGAVLDVATEEVRLIAQAQAQTHMPPIAIGTHGTLAGTEWEVVGYQQRSSEAGSWTWEEYLLFNPYRGFRFLGLDHGEWTLYGMLRRDVADGTHDPQTGRRYEAQDEVQARTDYVLGEFYWRVRVGDTVTAQEFTSDTYLLSREGSGDEVVWSRGVRIAPSVVEAAFGLSNKPPLSDAPPSGGTYEYTPYQKPRTPHRWRTALISLGLLTLLAAVPFGRDHDRLVLAKVTEITAADQDRTLPAIPLTIPDRGGNLRLDSSANAMGGLLRIDIALAAQDGVWRRDLTFQFGTLVGGGLEEGNTTIASVPGGNYTLLIKPHSSLFNTAAANGGLTAPPPPSPTTPTRLTFSIALHRHVIDGGMLVLAVFALLCWPILASVWHWLKRFGGRS